MVTKITKFVGLAYMIFVLYIKLMFDFQMIKNKILTPTDMVYKFFGIVLSWLHLPLKSMNSILQHIRMYTITLIK